MGRISETLIKEIRDKANITEIIGEYIHLNKKGKNYWALCPFHTDTKPSLSVSKDKQIYKCFVCGEAGNVFTFLQKFLNISYVESVIAVAKKVGIENTELKVSEKKPLSIEEQTILQINQEAFNFFKFNLLNALPENASDYLKTRNLSKEIMDTFSIGYAPSSNQGSLQQYLKSKGFNEKSIYDAGLLTQTETGFYDLFTNRIMFTIRNEDNEIIGFSGRAIDKQALPKYLNSPETIVFKKGQTLYNYHQVKKLRKTDNIYILEGFMDVIAMHKIGIFNAIATMGTSFTEKHFQLVRKISNNIVLCFDNDNAGKNTTLKTGSQLFVKNFNVNAVKSYDSAIKDVDEFLNANGIEKATEIIKDVQPFLTYKYIQLTKASDESVESKTNAINSIMNDIVQLKDEVKMEGYVKWLADFTNTSEKAITSKYNLAIRQNDDTNYAFVKNSIKEQEVSEIAEYQLLAFMISNPKQVVKMYREQLNYLNNKFNQEIADFICARVISNQKINLAEIMDEISDQAKSNLSQISDDNCLEEYSLELLHDCIKTIKNKFIDNQIAQLVQKNNSNISNEHKSININNIIKLKKLKEHIKNEKKEKDGAKKA